MSADPSKIKAIATAGHPQTTGEVKSFLQACQYNTKFVFDSDQVYAQVTQPLHQLTGKNVRFAWTPACESAYQEILCIMIAETALRPFNPAKPSWSPMQDQLGLQPVSSRRKRHLPGPSQPCQSQSNSM